MEINQRIKVERAIVRAAIEGLLAAGYLVVYFDGEETATPPTKNLEALMEECHTTDEAELKVYAEGDTYGRTLKGYVFLVFGNDGYDVIADYSTAVRKSLATADLLARLLGEYQGTAEDLDFVLEGLQ